MVNKTNSSKGKLNQHDQLPKKVFRFRVIGMAFGGLPIAVILLELQSSVLVWLWWFFGCYLWPHLALFFAKKSSNPFKFERNNLIFDSFIAGTWTALLHFNLLPAVLLLAITVADKVSSGIKDLWLYSMPFMFLGILLPAALTGFAYQPVSSMNVIIACLPILILHTLLVSMGSYQLVRKVQLQNRKLRELSQKDPLTSLYNRRHWQQQTQELMKQCATSNTSATLILIDIDYFKQINDTHGHSIGDDVLIAISKIITQAIPENSIAGRLGGDEFAIAVPRNLEKSRILAENISQQVKTIQLETQTKLICSISIGISGFDNASTSDLRNWFDKADKNLNQAKDSGRNKIIIIS